MREINLEYITKIIAKMSIEANYLLEEDVIKKLNDAHKKEEEQIGKKVLAKIILNAKVAKEEKCPMCQDTGMVCLFIKIGQEVHFVGGELEKAINKGVAEGYEKGYLRKSVVKDPLNRVNTNDNTPAIIHYEIVSGDKVEITLAPKGFGSENMSQIKMLKPTDGVKGVEEFVLKAVKEAGANPCPPIVVGVGIGGTFEKAAYLAKKAAIRSLDRRNKDKFYKELENELLEKVNKLGIGPAGFGGIATALAVNIEMFPTHIAGLPVAVNINCHAIRHKTVII